MTIQLEPFGFWSYAQKDDLYTDLRLSQLHDHIQKELELDYGDTLTLFRDDSDITTGAEWERMITGAIAKSSFLIPVITPTFLKRPWCMHEVRLFLEREEELCRRHPELAQQRMIFPIGYREIRAEEALDADIMAALQERQWIRIERLRGRDLADAALSNEIGKLILGVRQLLHIPIESEEERSARLANEQAAILTAEKSKRLEEEQRLAQQAKDEAARVKAADELRRAQQRKQETERVERERRTRARHEAAARRKAYWERSIKWLRQEALSVLIGVVLLPAIAMIAILIPRIPAPELANAQAVSANGSVDAGNGIELASGNLSGQPPLLASPPVHSWLYGRWGIEGDCSNTIGIEGDETSLTITTPFRSSPRRIQGESTDQSVTTDRGAYTLQPDGSVRSDEPDMRGLRLTRCSAEAGGEGP